MLFSVRDEDAENITLHINILLKKSAQFYTLLAYVVEVIKIDIRAKEVYLNQHDHTF